MTRKPPKQAPKRWCRMSATKMIRAYRLKQHGKSMEAAGLLTNVTERQERRLLDKVKGILGTPCCYVMIGALHVLNMMFVNDAERDDFLKMHAGGHFKEVHRHFWKEDKAA